MSKSQRKEEKPPDPTALDFEQAVSELEEIIDRLESGDVKLEDSLRDFERGTKLIKRSQEILSIAEQRIEELTTRADGKAPGGSDSAADTAD